MSIKTNLTRAAFDHETITIGGGQFSAEEILKEYRAMEKALEAARLLCANLANGGHGHMTLVNNFHNLDNSESWD
jgi:hypothetical protein